MIINQSIVFIHFIIQRNFKNEKGEVTGKKPIRLYFEQLTDGDKIKINNQINTYTKWH